MSLLTLDIPALLAGYDPENMRQPDEYYFDEQAGYAPIDFIESFCRHVEADLAGQLIRLEDWQKAFISTLFGWKRREDGKRRYRIAYLEVPRGNGKSTMAAPLALYMLGCDGEAGAQVFSAAVDKDQAKIVFSIAARMIERDECLREWFDVKQTVSRILHMKSGSFYAAVPADAEGIHGASIYGAVFDELHTQANRELWDGLKTGTGKRSQSLIIAITTAGYDKLSICWEQHEYARKVREGSIKDDTFLPVIFAADEDDEWTDPDVWAKANPNYGVTVRKRFLEQECDVARETPSYENTFRRLYLNQWTDQETRALAMSSWNACAGDCEGTDGVVAAGLDLSATQDLTSICLGRKVGGKFLFKPFYFVPEDSAKIYERKRGIPYSQWTRRGLVQKTPGRTIDYEAVRKKLHQLRDQYNLKQIGYDPWNARQLADQLTHDGFEMVEVRMGMVSMNEPTKFFLDCVADRRLVHPGHEVLDWNASNLETVTDASGNLRPVKPKDESKKIDGIVALIVALSRLMHAPQKKPSVYETRDMIEV